MADQLRNDPNVNVQVVDGDKGEFSITVDGRDVVRKDDPMPSVDEAVAAVRQALPAHA
ncbi:MAG TPA: hypothetical protein VM533_17810 [Fimbriiglobus sp.]|nr:hypothetical protein [Fimbriiglobus sp.]